MKLSLHKKIIPQTDMPPHPTAAKLDQHHPVDSLKVFDTTHSTPRVKWPAGRYSAGYNLIITIGGIAIAETLAMMVVYYFRSLPYYQQVILDAAIMTVIVFPLIYFLSSRPLLQHIQQRIQTENILQARLRLIRFANTHTLDELLKATLDEIKILTGSTIGYFRLLESEQPTLWSQALSKDSSYDVDQAGVWTDCIREGQPVIQNGHAALRHRNSLPEGQAPLGREMAVPILRDGKIMAILGLGNKPRNYTKSDADLVSTLADFAWDVVRDKQASEALRASEEKFRTLVDWTYDWELWLDPQGSLIYNSPSCERITGYRPEEIIDDPGLLTRLIHPLDRSSYQEHQRLVHGESVDVYKMEYRILDREGNEHWIEHVCRPLFGSGGHYLGRRVSNRDITERKQVERDIQERNRKEQMLTQTIHTLQLDIARDLHDTLGQNISFLRMKLDYLDGKKIRKQAELQSEIQNMARAANESYDLLRGTLAMLQSTNSTDLYRLFIRYTEQIEERSNFNIDFSSHGEPRPIAAPRMRQLFYIFREVLSNVEKHANASQVRIEMLWDVNHLKLVVSDNGQGFDVNAVQFGSHYGLKFMRERVELLNGSLVLHSDPGSGTNVAVLIPYETS